MPLASSYLQPRNIVLSDTKNAYNEPMTKRDITFFKKHTTLGTPMFTPNKLIM